MDSPNTPPKPPHPYASTAFAPPQGFWQKINWRIIFFAAIVVIIPGYFVISWASEVITGGIHNEGKYKFVDLKAMSTFSMDQQSASMDDIPQRFRELEGQEVSMIGEMWAPHAAGNGNLSQFQLVYSKTKCCFSGPPLAQHFVDGNVVTGKKVVYYDSPVKVFGKLHVSIHKEGDVIKSIYHVDVDKVIPTNG